MASRPPATLDPTAQALVAWLKGQTVGDYTPVEVRLDRREDSGDDLSWFFEVVLPNPPRGSTWDVDAMATLMREFRDEALTRDLSWPWYVFFAPEVDEPQDDEQPDP